MPSRPAHAIGFLLGFWLALVAFSSLLPVAAQSAAAAAPALALLEAELASSVNGYRGQHRLIPLARRADLDAVARAHSRDMASRHYLSHRSPEGADWVARLGTARVEGFAMAGENVGVTSRGQPNQEILNGWIHSTVHRENLLARAYNTTGVGIARGADGSLYYTQLYLSFPIEP
jgi:uncharacterized protein YkwD